MDLMEQGGPGGFPNLENLTQMMAPKMAPMGPGPIQAGLYGMDRQRQQEMLQQTMMLAQLGQKIKEMQAGEFTAGHEGRMSKIRTGEAMAKDEEDALPTTLETKDQDRQNKASKSRAESLTTALKEIEPYVNAHAGAETEDQKLAVKQEMADAGVTFGKNKVKIGELSDGDFDVFMKNARNKLTNTGKDELEREKLKSKETIAAGNNAARLSLQGRKEALALKLKKAGIDATKDNQPLIDQLGRKAIAEGLNQVEQDIYDNLLLMKSYGSIVKGDTDKGSLVIDPKSGLPKREKAAVTAPPRTPDSAKKGAEVEYKTAAEVKAAFKSGKLDRAKAKQILKDKFNLE